MWIKINVEGCRFSIPLPTGILINGFAVRIAKKCIMKNYCDFSFTEEQLIAFFKELKKAKKLFQRLTLVDVKTSDGQRVTITL